MSETKVITGKVRCSYVHVFEPVAINDGDTKKYSVSLLIPKKDKKTLEKIEKAIAAALENGKASKFGGKIPKKWKNPLRDGDEDREDDENYAGMMFINASSLQKPGVVDAELNPIIDREEFYSGCFARASVNFYAFNTAGNVGIACGLNNLQKLDEGERLSGGASTAEEDFGKEDDLF